MTFDMTKFTDEYASIEDMQHWAEWMMNSRVPDFIINVDYMLRWYVIPRNDCQNLYLHKLLREDPDVMHDHPWDSVSFIIAGGFIEHTPEGVFERKPGDVVQRKATDLHRLELIDGQPSISLFFTGPKIREWGFDCPGGWVHWKDFTGGYHNGRSDKGAGCGEP